MTVRTWAQDYCFERGMFENDAKAVVDSVVATFKDEIDLKWDDPVDAYPEELYAAIALWLNQKAIEWIETNRPRAWYKACFE